MRILLIGADGQLGSDIRRELENAGISVTPLVKEDMDISRRNEVEEVIRPGISAGLVINTASYHHVEKCEKDPYNSFRVNGAGAANLADACREAGIPLMHMSTDYVFDGRKKKPYTEEDLPNPLSVYAASKLSGEYLIRSRWEKHYILRLSGIYGSHICMEKGYNFVDKILGIGEERGEVKVVDNEVLTPTFTEDIAAQIRHMITEEAEFGLYHVSAEGKCSWYEFAKEIFKIKGNGVRVRRAAAGEFSGGVKRPAWSVMENRRLKDQRLNIMPHWKEGLKRYITLYR